MYRPASVIVGEVLGRVDKIADKWQRKALEGQRKFDTWYDVFENTVGTFVQTKVGETLDREGMEALINSIKNAKRTYAQKRR